MIKYIGNTEKKRTTFITLQEKNIKIISHRNYIEDDIQFFQKWINSTYLMDII